MDLLYGINVKRAVYNFKIFLRVNELVSPNKNAFMAVNFGDRWRTVIRLLTVRLFLTQ